MRMRIGVAAVALAVGLAGCDSSGVTCSSDDVTNLVKKIGRQQLAKNGTMNLVFDVEKTQFDISDIVTTGTEGTRCECKASLKITWALSKYAQNMKDHDPVGWISYKSNNMPNAEDKTTTLPIEYTGQPSDDGKSVYVQASGF